MKRSNFIKVLLAGTAGISLLGYIPKAESSHLVSSDGLWEIDGNTKAIRYIGPTDGPPITVLQLHRMIQDWADDVSNIHLPNPSTKISDNWIELHEPYHIEKGWDKIKDGTVVAHKEEGSEWYMSAVSFGTPPTIYL